MRIIFNVICLCISLSATQAYSIEQREIPNNGEPFTVHFESSSQCNLGDMDAISMELREHKFKKVPTRVLITAESFNGDISWSAETNIPGFLDKSEPELKPVELELPAVSKPTLIGIFICKDSSSGRTCKDKNLQYYQKTFDRHLAKLSDGKSDSYMPENLRDPFKTGPDTIYYFQPAILTPSSLKIITEDYNKENLKELVASLQSQGLADAQSADFVERGIRLVTSPNLKLRDGKIILNMPHADPTICGAKPPIIK